MHSHAHVPNKLSWSHPATHACIGKFKPKHEIPALYRFYMYINDPCSEPFFSCPTIDGSSRGQIEILSAQLVVI